ncbi:MAG: glycosyltransferase family 2 protein [Fimbriimonadaceae bacterium]
MADYPAITVIVPVYQVAQYLEECVDSVLGQTFAEFELVLVDDGSTDGSGELCEHYAKLDHRVRTIHQPNRGLSAARNVGMEAARGAWILFLDADDTLHPHCLERLWSGALEVPEQVNIIAGSIELFGGRTDRVAFAVPDTGFHRLPLAHILLGALLPFPSSVPFVSTWGKLHRSSSLSRFRFPEGKTFEDLRSMPARALLSPSGWWVTSESLYRYRVGRPGSITTAATFARAYAEAEAWFILAKDLRKMFLETELRRALRPTQARARLLARQALKQAHGLKDHLRALGLVLKSGLLEPGLGTSAHFAKALAILVAAAMERRRASARGS